MKLSLSLLFALTVFSASSFAEAVTVHFRGILDLGGSRLFSMATDGGASTAWVAEGDSFAGYKVTGFRAEENVLVLEADGVEFTVPLASGGNFETRGEGAVLNEATELLQSMKFEEMLAASLEQQREAMSTFSRQMMQQMGQEVDEEAIALQMRIMDLINEAMDWPNLQDDVARLYGETFTPAELRGLIDFYSTPAGTAFAEKQPKLNQGMMAIVQPKIMQAMPRIQQLIEETVTEGMPRDIPDQDEGSVE